MLPSLLPRSARVFVVLAGIVPMLAGAQSQREIGRGPALPPANFVQPTVGTVLRYEGFSNRITGGEGARTFFVDNQNRPGLRLATFFPDNPVQPVRVDLDSLAMLWPLSVGKRTTVGLGRGQERWRVEARVIDTERVRVPAGTFDTYVVTLLESPQLVRNPATAITSLTTFWYAPRINAVVRLLNLSTAPNGTKRTRRVQLLGVDSVVPRPGR
jgi:hypothetical protein